MFLIELKLISKIPLYGVFIVVCLLRKAQELASLLVIILLLVING